MLNPCCCSHRALGPSACMYSLVQSLVHSFSNIIFLAQAWRLSCIDRCIVSFYAWLYCAPSPCNSTLPVALPHRTLGKIWRRAGFALFGVFNGTEVDENFVARKLCTASESVLLSLAVEAQAIYNQSSSIVDPRLCSRFLVDHRCLGDSRAGSVSMRLSATSFPRSIVLCGRIACWSTTKVQHSVLSIRRLFTSIFLSCGSHGVLSCPVGSGVGTICTLWSGMSRVAEWCLRRSNALQ